MTIEARLKQLALLTCVLLMGCQTSMNTRLSLNSDDPEPSNVSPAPSTSPSSFPAPASTPSSPSIIGKSYYVTSDSALPGGDGEKTTPFRSISAALAVAQPGDAVVLLDGAYLIDTAITFPRSGTAGRPITLMKDPDGSTGAVLRCTNTPRATRGIEITRSHITVDGLEITNCGLDGIRIDGDVNGAPSGQDYGLYYDYYSANPARPYRVNGADYVTIQNCYIREVDGDGLKVSRTNHTEILNNRIFKAGRSSTGQGIDFLGVYDSRIAFNEIWDSPSPAWGTDAAFFAKGGSQNILVENNHVHDINPSQYCLMAGQDTEGYNTRYNPSAVSAEFHREMSECSFDGCVSCNPSKCVGDPTVRDPYFVINYRDWYVNETMAEGRNITMRGNLLVNCYFPFASWNGYNVFIYNNTAVSSAYSAGPFIARHDGVNPDRSGPLGSFAYHYSENLRVFNNLIYNPGMTIGGVNAVTYNLANFITGTLRGDNNLYFGTNARTAAFLYGQDAHAIVNVNPSLDAAYGLTSGSVARGAAANLRALGILGPAETWVDRNGKFHPNSDGSDDIGAFKF